MAPQHETQASGAAPAWSDPELSNPHASEAKADKVRRMFASIAGSYDLNNRLHSLWRDQAWRRFAVRAAEVRPGDRVLDVACGTGDLTQAFAATAAGSVIGLDYTPEMLAIARTKQSRLTGGKGKGGRGKGLEKITYMDGDAMALPFEDKSFDVLSIAFGIRNVRDPHAALREFFRVLRPGGRLIVLEFDTPRNRVLRWFNGVYCAKIMPRTATLVSGDRSGAYKYLPASVGTFWDRSKLLEAIAGAGFTHGHATGLTLGICVCSKARRPHA